MPPRLRRSRWATGSRLLSAAALVAVLVFVIWYLPAEATTLLVVVAAALAGAELAHLAAAIGAGVPAAFVAIASGFIALAVVSTSPLGALTDSQLLTTLILLLLAGGSTTLILAPPSPATLTRAAVLVMAPVYVGVPLGLFAYFQTNLGPATVTWLLAVIAISDSAQYFAGRAFGRRALAPAISPKKTVEGLVGGLAAAAIFGALSSSFVLDGVSAGLGMVLATTLAVAGVVGDLFESALKRGARVKDSSTLIPGHGGVLDRVDSHLFAAPAFFVCSRYWL